MARLIIQTAGEDVTVGGTDVEVIGTAEGSETITVTGGTVTFDGTFAAGGDTIAIEGEAEDYTATVNGSRLVLTGANGVTVSVPVGPNGVEIEFGGDDSRVLMINADGDLMLGEQQIATTGETVLTPGTDEVTTLTQALENLQDAQEALATFLAAADGDNNPNTSATEQDVIDARDDARDLLNDDITGTGTAAGETAGSDAQLQANLSDAEDELEEAQADVALTTGLSGAINDLEDAQEEYQADITTANVAYAEANGEAATFNVRNSLGGQPGEVFVVPDNAEDFSDLTANDPVLVNTAGDTVVELAADGTLQVTAGSTAYLSTPGFAALLADLRAAYAAAEDMDASQEVFEDAIEDVLVLEGNVANPDGSAYYTEADGELNPAFDADAPDTVALFDARDAVEAAEADIEERNELRADLAEAQDLVDQMDELNEDIDDAEEAIEQLGYEVPVTVSDTDNVNGTADSDIFVLDTGATGTGSATIDDFGTAGDDILFVGSGYTMTDLGATANLGGTSQGDVNALEIFIRQEGDDTVLYFEDEAFSGSATNGFQGFQVTLEDVDADTVSLDATGYITIEETATVA